MTYKKMIQNYHVLINQETIKRISEKLDSKSKAIVHYIWENKYASLAELAELYNASSHMDVLLRINNVINPLAEEMLGYPVVVFKRSKIDLETGRKVLFCWWLAGEEGKKTGKEELLEVFDEGDYLRIIMELFGVSEENIRLRVNSNKLIVFVNSAEKKYQEEIFLPARVYSKWLSKNYRNGVLEIKLKKLKSV